MFGGKGWFDQDDDEKAIGGFGVVPKGGAGPGLGSGGSPHSLSSPLVPTQLKTKVAEAQEPVQYGPGVFWKRNSANKDAGRSAMLGVPLSKQKAVQSMEGMAAPISTPDTRINLQDYMGGYEEAVDAAKVDQQLVGRVAKANQARLAREQALEAQERQKAGRYHAYTDGQDATVPDWYDVDKGHRTAREFQAAQKEMAAYSQRAEHGILTVHPEKYEDMMQDMAKREAENPNALNGLSARMKILRGVDQAARFFGASSDTARKITQGLAVAEYADDELWAVAKDAIYKMEMGAQAAKGTDLGKFGAREQMASHRADMPEITQNNWIADLGKGVDFGIDVGLDAMKAFPPTAPIALAISGMKDGGAAAFDMLQAGGNPQDTQTAAYVAASAGALPLFGGPLVKGVGGKLFKEVAGSSTAKSTVVRNMQAAAEKAGKPLQSLLHHSAVKNTVPILKTAAGTAAGRQVTGKVNASARDWMLKDDEKAND